MEQLIFSPADLPFIGLQYGGYGLTSEWASLDIFNTKSSETHQDMESSKRKNMQENLIRSFRKMKLKRLDEYKHAFIQFFSKRLSITRHSPQQSLHKTDHYGRNSKLIPTGHEKVEFNIPIATHDAIHYGKNPDVYFIGKYSQMKKCEWLGTQVTVRKIVLDDVSKEDMNVLVPEIQVLGQIRHPFILLLLAATYDDKHNLMLLYEHVDYGSLFVYLHEELRTPSVDFMLSILDQIARVLIFLHQSGWIHTNITSHAIQLMSFHRVKLSCFELAMNINSKNEINPLSNIIRNHLYHWQTPEYYAGLKFDTFTDIFQFGLLAWEVSQKQIPWSGLSQGELKEKYLSHKQVVNFKKDKSIPQLTTIMEQAINLRPKDRQLNLQKALKLLVLAKESTNRGQDYLQTIAANTKNQEICNNQSSWRKVLPKSDNHESKEDIAQKTIIQNSKKKADVKKGSLRESIPPSQKCSSLEDFKAVVDTYTGLRRVRESYLKRPNVIQQKMMHVSSTSSKTSADCSFSSKWTDEADYSDFSDDQEKKAYKRIFRKDNLINVHSSSSSSSMKKLSCNFSISSSTGIKPASHSLEKQPSASNSQEIFRSIGTSTPYRASAIKPASHQSQRGSSRMYSRTITGASKTVRCTNYLEIMRSSANLSKERCHQRVEPFISKCVAEDHQLTQNTKTYPENENKCFQSLHSKFSNHNNKSLYTTKETGASIKGTNLDQLYDGTKNEDQPLLAKLDEMHFLSDVTIDEEPEVITKICEQLLSMIKEPYIMKRERNGTKIFSNSTEKRNIKMGQTSNKDYNTKIHFKDAYSQKKTSLQVQSPSMSFLTMLGLNLMDYYEDDELGPSLWNDEHMQLRICQEFGKSLDTFINVEEFPFDQLSENIWRSDEEEIESDAELKNKCKFNSLYYKLSQNLEDQCLLRMEEKAIISKMKED